MNADTGALLWKTNLAAVAHGGLINSSAIVDNGTV